jgi:DNA repair photolyase
MGAQRRSPADRIKALRRFHERGIFTWVSLEPTLGIASSLAIVEATHSFVDLYKVGRVNYLPMTKTTDWRDYTVRMLDTLNRVGARHYIKKDLQPFLPAGYPNLLRVPQHH